MNSQIRELANKSGCYECYGVPSNWDDGDYIVTPKEMEKFAELIAKETEKEVRERFAKVCDGMTKYLPRHTEEKGSAYRSGYTDAVRDIAVYLREAKNERQQSDKRKCSRTTGILREAY